MREVERERGRRETEGKRRGERRTEVEKCVWCVVVHTCTIFGTQDFDICPVILIWTLYITSVRFEQSAGVEDMT